jgi:hypothetical protein
MVVFNDFDLNHEINLFDYFGIFFAKAESSQILHFRNDALLSQIFRVIKQNQFPIERVAKKSEFVDIF